MTAISGAAELLLGIRAGEFPAGAKAGDFDRLPIVDEARNIVSQEDLPLLLTQLRDSDEQAAAIVRLYSNKARDLLNAPRRPGSVGKLAVLAAAARAGFTLSDRL